MMNFLKRILNPFKVSDNIVKEIDELKSKAEFLFVGLGNPGSRYAGNRHNIGWMVISRLIMNCRKEPAPYSPDYLLAPLRIEGKAVLAAMPTTFMNRSGRAVSSIAKAFSIPNDRIVAVLDEYNFPVGRLHLKLGGSDGGHNGISSITEHLGNDNFYRLRCGIDRNFGQGCMADYVLSDFEQDELNARNMMIENAVIALRHIVRVGTQRAMSDINSGKIFNPT